MTPFIKKKEIKKDWYIINAQNAAVGRLAAYISVVLRGKNKATFNPHYQFQNAGTSCVSIVDNSDTYSVISPISFWLISKFNLDTSKIVFRRLSSSIPYSFGILTPSHQPMSQIAKSFLSYLEIQIENMLKEIDKKGVLFKI